jgi:hypothetical protein
MNQTVTALLAFVNEILATLPRHAGSYGSTLHLKIKALPTKITNAITWRIEDWRRGRLWAPGIEAIYHIEVQVETFDWLADMPWLPVFAGKLFLARRC